MSETARNIEQLTSTEKLELLQEIWESLARTPDSVPLTTAQRQELDRRLDELDRDGPVGVPWEEVVDRIQGRTPRSVALAIETLS